MIMSDDPCCPECGERHPPELPHNLTPYYHYQFYMRHGRRPHWNDAMAHCTAEVRTIWIEEMIAAMQEDGDTKKRGI
jgi:hypothetical protein